MRLFIFIVTAFMIQPSSFKETQLTKPRVKAAYDEKEHVIQKAFAEKKLVYEGFQMFLRAFKKEKKLEVWVREKQLSVYALLIIYDFCASSGSLGPKRREGDLQIPEGVYHINHFNPESNFHLSLGISYPNASDKILSDARQPGGAIYIHGNCVTIGCIPITDDKIKELYVLAVEARNNGQQRIPIHIFPTALDDNGLSSLEAVYGTTHLEFWKSLRPVYSHFEKTKTLTSVPVDAAGQYVMN